MLQSCALFMLLHSCVKGVLDPAGPASVPLLPTGQRQQPEQTWVGVSISEPNPATPLSRWAGSQEDQWQHPLTLSCSCAADGDTSAPSEDGFPQQQSFLLRQAVPMSDGLRMQQETPAQAGRAVAPLHCSAAMTVTKSGAELFASSTKSIVVPGRNYNCSISTS